MINERSNEWSCVKCSAPLGSVFGGEFIPTDSVPSKNLRTSGPNLIVTCPNCGAQKTWYTADPIVRSLYQLIDVVSTAVVARIVRQVSEKTLPPKGK